MGPPLHPKIFSETTVWPRKGTRAELWVAITKMHNIVFHTLLRHCENDSEGTRTVTNVPCTAPRHGAAGRCHGTSPWCTITAQWNEMAPRHSTTVWHCGTVPQCGAEVGHCTVAPCSGFAPLRHATAPLRGAELRHRAAALCNGTALWNCSAAPHCGTAPPGTAPRCGIVVYIATCSGTTAQHHAQPRHGTTAPHRGMGPWCHTTVLTMTMLHCAHVQSSCACESWEWSLLFAVSSQSW
jgi:hypothetical protein